jgi:hypothetical protein
MMVTSLQEKNTQISQVISSAGAGQELDAKARMCDIVGAFADTLCEAMLAHCEAKLATREAVLATREAPLATREAMLATREAKLATRRSHSSAVHMLERLHAMRCSSSEQCLLHKGLCFVVTSSALQQSFIA